MILRVIKMRNIVFLFVLMVGASQSQNLLDNPSFEGDLRGTWENNGFLMERVSGDTVDGNFALKASDRDRDVEGPSQVVRGLKPNGRYELNLYIKLLNDVKGSLYQKIRVSMQFLFVDSGKIGTYAIAFRSLCDSSMGWIHVNGSMNAPLKAFTTVRLGLRGPDAGVNFLMDNASLYEIPENTKWIADSYSMIDKYRKSNVDISFTTPSDVSPSAFDVQIRLKKHLFPFGVKVKDTQISATSNDEYTNLVVNMFNWATVQSYKWKFDKGDRYNPDFSNALTATNILVAKGLKVRAHNLLWDVPDNIPDWVLALSGQELRDELDKHVQYMCTLALGKVTHWDVMNEHTHGLYYEEKLQDQNFTKNLFRQMRKCDSSAKLYFNDYQAVDIGGSTQEYYHLMKEYLAQKVPVDGLGVQGHVQTDTTPDPTMIWRKLDRLGMLGLDIS
ncbi:uncharacterized protein LOC112554243 [Pomacea canaliculata]|uniref:uncharacterized protein LOC112554243 n=1 Tax=Pomacea canaliculata TaxID=400727 RepID=UPI000D737F65|nr:uncharacterized protein LOC112554243 [Pomacea canaliculata]